MKTERAQSVTVGVDTGKSTLDIHIRPLDLDWRVDNDAKGIASLIKQLKGYAIERIVVEATGRYELAFIIACAKAKLPFVIANPIHIKRFAGAIGRRAKTDTLDAQLIAHYGEAIQPSPSTLKPETMRLMADLVARRNQLLGMRTMEKNRLKIMPKSVASMIKPILTALDKQVDKIDGKLRQLIDSCPDYQHKSELVQSMPGIGKTAAATLISYLPELGYMNNKQAASLVGVAPINRESGRFIGKRTVQGGRAQVRTVLFMSIMSAIQCNNVFKQKYQQLLAQGKPKKVALIACVRKMVVILNSMVRDGQKWAA